MVVGMDFSIIAAASEEPSFFPEKVFGSLDATRPLLLSLTESSEYASVRDLDGWFRFPDHVTGLGSLCVNITQHGQSAYCSSTQKRIFLIPKAFFLNFLQK